MVGDGRGVGEVMASHAYLAVELGTGGEPSAAHHVAAAEAVARSGADLVIWADSFVAPDPAEPPTLDAVAVAARVAPVVPGIGLVPTVTVTHTEPFHISKAIATLDLVSQGRAGWQVAVSRTEEEALLFGRKPAAPPALLWREAAEAVEVVVRLWDSWEDDAVIRDVATGRYVDRDRLHYIDFTGTYFSVKGPSITPRPPQGQPVVVALAHQLPVYEFASRSVDLVFITPQDDDDVTSILGQVRQAGGTDLKVYADVFVSFSGTVDSRSDAVVFDSAPAELVELLARWQQLGLDGFRLRPAVNATDLPVIVDEVVPLLQRAGLFRTAYRDGERLRERLGLPVADNRYAREANS